MQREESKYVTEAACFRAAVTPNAGHDLNLQRNAQFSYDTIRTFADEALGQDRANKDGSALSAAPSPARTSTTGRRASAPDPHRRV